jgi:hypothetical protein
LIVAGFGSDVLGSAPKEKPMPRLPLDVEAGRLSAELERRGISAQTKARVLVEVGEAEPLPMAALAQVGGAFDFLADESDIYRDADVIDRAL